MNRLIYGLCMVGLCGCAAHQAHEEEHHHDAVLQVAGYSDGYEVFAEMSPLELGEESHVLAHFTRLGDFKPYDRGGVTASLVIGRDSVVAEGDSVRPGIYEFELTPNALGEARLWFNVGGEQVFCGNLTVFDNEHEAHEAAEAAEIKSSNGVAFSKEMGWKSDFATAPVERRKIGQTIRTMAQVLPSQSASASVVAKSSGIVAIPAELTVGKSVGHGQTLFKIDGGAMADNNLAVRYREAKSNYEAAQAELQRLKALERERLVTEAEVLAAQRDFDNAKAAYDALRDAFSDGGSVVASPMAGYITNINVDNGQYVEAGQTLATVATSNSVLLKAEVSPSLYAHLSNITDANFRRSGSDDVWSLSELDGQAVSYGHSVDADNPLLPIVFKLRNNGKMLPGTFVTAYISTGGGNEMTVVPDGALIEEMGNYFVYLQLTPEYFEKRQVAAGVSDGRYTAVTGVDVGDRVVSRGAVLVKLAHASGALDPHSGHVH